MPVVCLLTPSGTVVVPTADDDPPIDDGTDHVVRIAIHPVHPGDSSLPPLPRDCRLWQPGADVAVISSKGRDYDLTQLIVSSAVPRSVCGDGSARSRGARPRVGRMAPTVAVILAGFVAGWVTMRAITVRTHR